VKSFFFWQKWLFVVGVVVSVFGVLMALLSGTPLFDLFNHQIDPAFWHANAVDTAAKQFQQWIYGVWGATLAGWGIILAYIARYPFIKKERWAWICLLVGFLVWFVLDTSLSLIHEVYFNAVFNIVLFVFGILPLIFTRKEFI
jgi:zinc transporter ZupT